MNTWSSHSAGEGRPLPPRLAQEITREIERLGLVQQQIAAIEHERDESPTTCKETEKKRAQLLLLKGIGATGSAVMSSLPSLLDAVKVEATGMDV